MQSVRALAVALILVTGAAITPVPAAKILDDPNGFNGHAWGAPLAKFAGFKLVKDLGSTDFVKDVGVYENPGETLTLNEVPMATIRYRFVENQLESISFRYTGRENRNKLVRWLEERYGKLTAPERRMVNALSWFGDQTVINLKYDVVTKNGVLYVFSKALSHRFNEVHQATQGD